ncbi:MAG: excinuclease ABC subunit UvrC [Planctomycetes bacterium]|nr:excinuclease ABC subunit UvrC [Planctomycetota bacterium]
MNQPTESLLERQIGAAPHAPGCYIFRDDREKVLYVGKAKDLAARVRSYLRPGQDGRPQIPFLMQLATSVEFVVMNNEKEALVLENNLIKRFRPRFNVLLATDDKTFLSVRIDMKHDFPRATMVHKYKRDGAVYFGPYHNSAALYKTLEVLKRVYPLRLCSDHVMRNRSRPCVYHDIGVCSAPCMPGMVSKEQYAEMLKGFVRVLKGRDDTVVRQTERAMNEAAAKQEYEQAAELRDRWQALKATLLRQRAQAGDDAVFNRDVIGLHREADQCSVVVLMYRDGKLGNTSKHMIASLLPDEELVAGFVKEFYGFGGNVPEEILLPVALDDSEALADWLSEKAEARVGLLWPQRGDKAQMLELANVNARHALKVRAETEDRDKQLIRELQEAVGLERAPVRMECYDISHSAGKETVASGVCFIDGKPSKANYRKYKIRSHDRNDDFASMEEVLRRRLKRGLEEGGLPDLIVIDGGPGQLGRVQKVFEEMNVVGIDLISLAKSRDRSAPAWDKEGAQDVQTKERVFVPGSDQPIELDPRSPALFLLVRIRDEAHRFAITFHRLQKRREGVSSSLDSIPGVGPKKKKALIRHFGSPKGVKLASLEALQQAEGINAKLAQAIYEALAEERARLQAQPQDPSA